jgi:hypothetical protein
MRYLDAEAGDKTQVVVTTHSPNFAAASGVERMTVMTRAGAGQPIVGRSPASFGLEKKALDHLRRFLDVTKASLLFARGGGGIGARRGGDGLRVARGRPTILRTPSRRSSGSLANVPNRRTA